MLTNVVKFGYVAIVFLYKNSVSISLLINILQTWEKKSIHFLN